MLFYYTIYQSCVIDFAKSLRLECFFITQNKIKAHLSIQPDLIVYIFKISLLNCILSFVGYGKIGIVLSVLHAAAPLYTELTPPLPFYLKKKKKAQYVTPRYEIIFPRKLLYQLNLGSGQRSDMSPSRFVRGNRGKSGSDHLVSSGAWCLLCLMGHGIDIRPWILFQARKSGFLLYLTGQINQEGFYNSTLEGNFDFRLSLIWMD